MDKAVRDVVERQRIARPIAVYSQDFADGEAADTHHHPRGQLLWPASGAIRLETPGHAWMVPAERAIWIPPNLPHGFTAAGATRIHTLYATLEAAEAMPGEARAVATTGLLRELLARALSFPLLYDEAGLEGMVMRLILAEIAALPSLPLAVPTPTDPRLRRFSDAVLRGDEGDLEVWAGRLAMSARTFSRRFQAETGLTPAGFRRQARLLAALKSLASGSGVTTAAFDAGYETPSAFIEAFRAAFGETPGAFARRA